MKKQINLGVKCIPNQVAENLKTSLEHADRTQAQEVLLKMVRTGVRLSEAIKLVESGGRAKFNNR